MRGPLRLMPRSWKTSVTVLRGGGRDSHGNPLEPERIPVTGCLIGPRSTNEPLDRTDLVDTKAVLYHEDFGFLPTDRIEVPEGARMAGTWAVDGMPGEWPFGVEVGIVRN